MLAGTALWALIPGSSRDNWPANDSGIVQHINLNVQSWNASESPFFKSWTRADVRSLENVMISESGRRSGEFCPTERTEQVPEFDSRLEWIDCFQDLPVVHAGGNCTSTL